MSRTIEVEVPASKVEVGHLVSSQGYEVIDVVREPEADLVVVSLGDALGIFDVKARSLSTGSLTYLVDVPKPEDLSAH